MDVGKLTTQLTPADRLPGVAFLVAREVVETSAISGQVSGDAARHLQRAVEHLRVALAGGGLEQVQPVLIGQLIHIAETRSLPDRRTLEHVRSALRDLVRANPSEGSVSVEAGYVGF